VSKSLQAFYIKILIREIEMKIIALSCNWIKKVLNSIVNLKSFLFLSCILFLIQSINVAQGQSLKIILDTDLGGDIDDAFAHALVQASQEFQVIGITTADGPTEFRAQVSCRMLYNCGQDSIPVAVGRPTRLEASSRSNQMRWADGFDRLHPIEISAADFIIQKLRAYPNQITIISIGPVTNLGDVIDKDPAAWKMVKEVISMFGSFYVGYGAGSPPAAEYNVATDIESAKKLIASGVPLTLAGTDVTAMVNFGPERRLQLLMRCSPLTDALSGLYSLWSSNKPGRDPILYDPVAVAMALTDEFVKTRPACVRVTDQGYTVIDESQSPNCRIGVAIKKDLFLQWFTNRLLKQNLSKSFNE
jgi:purine nucleosidase